ncbi:thioredoxin H4-1-like [Durio zibethinus]|uniref:Thioredoxin H4-1-like n=1 Tax=Durio zibethinus TaxID=66656 RepID=A0A6P6AHH1_DURZI|nr:thioredoxin H4-1-like [Durio zibethinus]
MGHRWTKVSRLKQADYNAKNNAFDFLQFFKCRMGDVKDHQDRHVEFASRNVHHITTIQSWEEKLTEATRDGKILVANFSAPWSGPCRSIAPIYCELADKYPSFMFLTVDVDALAEFSTSWDINATPTFFFLKDGRQVDKFVGADKVELPKKIAAVANLTSRF